LTLERLKSESSFWSGFSGLSVNTKRARRVPRVFAARIQLSEDPETFQRKFFH
jgi:hypothetical protein